MPSTSIYALPYPAPGDSPAGHTQMQALANAVESALQGPVMLVTQTGTQVIGDSTDTALVWNSAMHNPDGAWDSDEADRFTAPGSGTQVWGVFAQCAWSQSSETGLRDLWFELNGVGGQHHWRTRSQSNDYDQYMTIAGIVVISGGGYVRVMANQTSGGDLDLIASKSRFGAIRLR